MSVTQEATATPYEDMSPKQQIASILDISDDDGWYISDDRPDEHLYLIHPNNTHAEQYGDLRGVVVDTKYQTVVARSHGHIPIVIADELVPGADGNIKLVDENGSQILMEDGSYSIKPGYDGVYVRIFLHGGHIYIASHRKLDISGSSWGNAPGSPTFREMYDRLGGPTGKDLFGYGAKYSPYVHGWMIVTPELANVTKAVLGNGYLVYLGPKQMFDLGAEAPFPQWDLDTMLWIPPNTTTNPERAVTEGHYLSPPDLSLEQANHRLNWGEYAPWDDRDYDPRLGTGEFIVVYIKDNIGRIKQVVHIESTAYHWRTDIRDSNPNLLFRFYQLVNMMYIDASSPDGLVSFQQKMPIMSRWGVDSIIDRVEKGNPLIVWEQSDDNTAELIATKDDRLYNAWACLLVSVPLHKQIEIVRMYNDFFTKRAELIEWIRDLDSSGDFSDPLLIDRVI